MTDITRLTDGTAGDVTLADLVREILHSEYDRPGQRRILANVLRSNEGALREKIFVTLRCVDGLAALSDAEIERAVSEFIDVIKERPS